MANSPEANKRRLEQLVWVYDDTQPEGGYEYAAAVSPERHGSKATYVNWGCRCPHCTLANTNDQGIRRHAKRLAAFAAERTHLFSQVYTKMVVGISRGPRPPKA